MPPSSFGSCIATTTPSDVHTFAASKPKHRLDVASQSQPSGSEGIPVVFPVQNYEVRATGDTTDCIPDIYLLPHRRPPPVTVSVSSSTLSGPGFTWLAVS